MELAHPDLALLTAALLLFVAVFASKTSGRLGVPSLLVFMLLGWALGPELLGLARVTDWNWLSSLSIIALSIILFTGGMDTNFSHVRPILWRSVSLATLGVVLTSILTALAAYMAFRPVGITPAQSFLMGAIISSTDAAAVFSVLRSRGLGLKHRLKPTLEFESGSNDPMALLLTSTAIAWLVGEQANPWLMGLQLFTNLGIGALLGIGIGWLIPRLINRVALPYDGLFSVLVLSVSIFVYSVAELLHGNGLLAVYCAGIMIGKEAFIHKQSVLKFFDGISWIMQIVIFVALGLVLNFEQLLKHAPQALIVALALMFVARTLSVYISLLPFKGIGHPEKLFISWVGLKGAAPLVFAIMPFMFIGHGIEEEFAYTVLNVIMFIVILSVLIQGTTLVPVARLFRVDLPATESTNYPLQIEHRQNFQSFLQEIIVPDYSTAIGRKIVELHLPVDSLIILISRDDGFIMPNGNSEILHGDRLLVLATTSQDLHGVYDALGIELQETT